jgi:hypothetical protein
MNNSISHLLSLPRELIYKIAAVDAGAYNIILRLCRVTASLFPLSTRLDFMIDFGVTVKFETTCDDAPQTATVWYWEDEIHDIFGPAISWEDGDINYYWHDKNHRDDGPASMTRTHLMWWHHDVPYRDPAAPSGTGVEWLKGATFISERDRSVFVSWHCHYITSKQHTIDDSKVRSVEYTSAVGIAQVHAEIAYWWSRV